MAAVDTDRTLSVLRLAMTACGCSGAFTADSTGIVAAVGADPVPLAAESIKRIIGRVVREGPLVVRDFSGLPFCAAVPYTADHVVGVWSDFELTQSAERVLEHLVDCGGILARDETNDYAVLSELRISEERLRAAQQASGIGVWDWDLAFGKMICSDVTLGLYGCTSVPEISEWLAMVDARDAIELPRS